MYETLKLIVEFYNSVRLWRRSKITVVFRVKTIGQIGKINLGSKDLMICNSFLNTVLVKGF